MVCPASIKSNIAEAVKVRSDEYGIKYKQLYTIPYPEAKVFIPPKA